MTNIIGRFHPLIIHFPIVCLLFAAFLQYLINVRQRPMQEALNLTLLIGTVSSILACISGYFLSASHEDSNTIFYHKWLGICTMIFSIGVWYLNKIQHSYNHFLLYFTACMVIVTSHFGGSLTHGEDYLFPKKKTVIKKEISDINEALVYEDIIKPILSDKCYTCHSNQRQKGRLRLDDLSFMLKGGENGPALISNQADQSLMIKRMLLPLHEKEHMPPKSKPQPSAKELALIQWWINNGTSTTKKTKECSQDEKIKQILSTWNDKSSLPAVLPAITTTPDDQAISYLNSRGVSIQPLSKGSKLFAINFIANDSITKKDIEALDKIKDHIYILKLGHCKFEKKILNNISIYKNLSALYLENTKLDDDDIMSLQNLSSLYYLNVINNKLTKQGIESLCKIKSLKKLYIFQNNVSGEEVKILKEKYRDVNIVLKD